MSKHLATEAREKLLTGRNVKLYQALPPLVGLRERDRSRRTSEREETERHSNNNNNNINNTILRKMCNNLILGNIASS